MGLLRCLWSRGSGLAQNQRVESSIAAYRARMQDDSARAAQPMTPVTGSAAGRKTEPQVMTADGRRRAALLTEPPVHELPSPDLLLREIPDPVEADRIFQFRLERVRKSSTERRVARRYEKVVAEAKRYLKQLRLPRQMEMSLEECVRRALEHNYTIRMESYRPAISRAQLVQAEAAFDAVFFLDFVYNNTDQPSPTQLAGNQSDTRSYTGGIRQLLPTGTRVSTSLGQSRTFTDLQFATINPAYNTSFVASLTQPILRGFGLDYNLAPVNLRRIDLRISQAQFEQNVRDTVLSVEQAYWQLVSARRRVMILAESVAQNRETYESMYQRREHDASPVEIANSESRWNSRYVEYLESVKLVRDAEDALKNLLNDPELLLSDDIEIIPTATPMATPIALDHFAEVRTALDERSEIHQAREQVESARINTAVAKNETLPQLDVSLQYTVHGLNLSADSSFDKLTTNRFRSYAVTVNFAAPIGNRAARAALRAARMQESQALLALQRVMDGVVTEVNNAIRTMNVRFAQLPVQYQAVTTAESTLRALQARTQNISPSFLETELSNIEQLANTRTRLLQVLVDYNVSVIELEKAKGTLLEYNNIHIAE
ncbi:MAG: TolC family protein [Planctomycetota bacterium]|nr:MAG: TolC family protein [Planctomycetota bacterium]